MEQLVQLLILGSLIGIVYALMALGLTLIFGVMRMVNFAHGEFYMLGSFAYALTAENLVGLPPYVALLTAPTAAFALGWLTHRTLLRAPPPFSRFRYADYMLIVTFALSIVLQNLAIVLSGGGYLKPPSLASGNLVIGSLNVSGDRLVAAGVALLLMAALWLFMRRSFVGRSWRAVTQSPLGAQVVGIDADGTSRLAFATAAALAGAAGGLLAPLYLVYPTNGVPALTQGFVVVILGGLGSIPGSLIGGLLVGVTNALGTGYLSSAYSGVYGFILMTIVLLWRPRGLFGERTRRF